MEINIGKSEEIELRIEDEMMKKLRDMLKKEEKKVRFEGKRIKMKEKKCGEKILKIKNGMIEKEKRR